MPGASVKVGPVRVGSGCCVALVIPLLVAVVVGALILSGCGSTSSSSGPYYNMTTLANAIKEKIQDEHPAEATSEITCIKTGKQTAECNASNGEEKASVEVNISEDGNSFITH